MEQESESCMSSVAQYDYRTLMAMSPIDILEITKRMGIVGDGFKSKDDLIDRIILIQRKAQGTSHTPFEKFSEVKSDMDDKCGSLRHTLEMLHLAFSKICTEPLSDVLLKEGLLTHNDLLDEILARIRAIVAKELLVIIAGETNGGKSTFLNLMLGEPILPTDVIHCTYAVTIIKYSETYSIEALNQSGVVEVHPCERCEDAHEKLKKLVAEEDQVSRLTGSKYKEITLKMPAKILKSGMVLVDTPGIGEMEQMDNVTMNYIKSTRAAAFIYIIKSDTAGGVQEDRLVSFLRAIQEDYKNDGVDCAIDPRAALFVCNRWDQILENNGEIEEEIVKLNAYTKLDIVWPGFQRDQLHFFSSKKALLHFEADPEFVTDKLNDLLLGMTKLFHRTAHNHIQHQYRWTKSLLQRSSRHLCSMINHCNTNNEELESFFRTVAAKQDILMNKASANNPELQEALAFFKDLLKSEIRTVLSTVECDQLNEYGQLVSIITPEFVRDSKNKEDMDQWIVNSLINYCNLRIQESGTLESVESEAKKLIERHIGLHKEQITEITELVRGPSEKKRRQSVLPIDLSSSSNSSGSSGRSSMFDMFEHTTLNPSQIENTVKAFFQKKKKSKGLLTLPPNIKGKMVSALQKAKRQGGSGGRSNNDIPDYVQRRIQKNATAMMNCEEIVEELAAGYLYVTEGYIEAAIEHIPHFIKINNKLLNSIRDHRRLLHEDKGAMKYVIGALEPIRERIRGYALLYMDDLNIDSVDFNTAGQVTINNQFLDVSVRWADSGFIESGSTRNGGRGFWTHTRKAVIKLDGKPTEVTLKTYTSRMDKDLQFSEIASLRYLEHPSLAPFLGMTRVTCNNDGMNASEKMTCFIFKGALLSAMVYKRNRLIDQKKFAKGFIEELISGLEYLHKENMVHLELNLDTVMVDSVNGNVQLCQQCKPREIVLPKDPNVVTKSSVCLSPSVLDGAEYTAADDIYAFVLLLWELLFPDNIPYEEQRRWPLEEFREKVSPTDMLGPEIEKLEASDGVLRVLRGALLNRRKSRIDASDIRRLLKEDLDDDTAFLNMKRSRRAPVKRNSRESMTLDMTESESVELNADHLDSLPVRPPRRTDGRRRVSAPNMPHDAPSMNYTAFPLDIQTHRLCNPYEGSIKNTESGIDFLSTSTGKSNFSQDQSRNRRTRKVSAPNIKLQDQKKLQEMYEEMQKAKLAEEENVNACVQNPEVHNSPSTSLWGTHRKLSVPDITFGSDQTSSQNWYEDMQRSKITEETEIRLSSRVLRDDSSPSLDARRRQKKRSVPNIKICDQKKLQSMYDEMHTNKLDEDPHLSTSFEGRDKSASPKMENCRRGRKWSVPNIDFTDQKKVQELADSIEKEKKKNKWWKINRKAPIKKQQNIDEDRVGLEAGERNALYASTPGNINMVPVDQSKNQKKSIYDRFMKKNSAKNENKDERHPSPRRTSTSVLDSVPNLVKLAGEQRCKWRNSKTNLSDDGPTTTSHGLLSSIDTTGSPRTQQRDRRVSSESPAFAHRWSRGSIKSNSSIESDNDCTMDNRPRSKSRSDSNTSLYSMYVKSILLERNTSARSSISNPSDIDEFHSSLQTTPHDNILSCGEEEEEVIESQPSPTVQRRVPDINGNSQTGALPNLNDVGSDTLFNASVPCHVDDRNGHADSTLLASIKDLEDTFDASSALPFIWNSGKAFQEKTESDFDFTSPANALPNANGFGNDLSLDKSVSGDVEARDRTSFSSSIRELEARREYSFSRKRLEDDRIPSNELPSLSDYYNDFGASSALPPEGVEDNWSSSACGHNVWCLDKNDNILPTSSCNFLPTDSTTADFSTSLALPPEGVKIQTSGYFSSSDVDNDSERPKRAIHETSEEALSDKLPTISFADMSFADND